MEVVLWKTPGCPRCKGVSQQLAAKGIKFSQNEDADKLVDLGFTSAPILQVGDQYLVGKDIYT